MNGTVARVRELRPRKLLEIGCGVGLLLQHLAPQCERYLGTDISAAALAQLRRWMKGRGALEHVELLHRPADRLMELPSGEFDTIVLNSVVQYFPDAEYLIAVLQEAVRLLEPGGRVFLGDIRHLGLLTAFHTEVQLAKAPDSLSMGQLRKRIVQAVEREKELVIDPNLFRALPGNLPSVATTQIQLKPGRAQNELTCYRYDVVLHKGEIGVSEPLAERAQPWSAYTNDPLANIFRQQLVPRLREHLQGRLPEYMIPSAWVILNRLPLTPNGKLDRGALPVPGEESLAHRQYEAPVGEVEEILAGIWQDLLGAERAGRQDNFFELGGHSLTAMRLMQRVSERFAIQFNVQAVFRYANFREMAQFVKEMRPDSQQVPASGPGELDQGII